MPYSNSEAKRTEEGSKKDMVDEYENQHQKITPQKTDLREVKVNPIPNSLLPKKSNSVLLYIPVAPAKH